jgi:MarR family transcriptional regulator for hemolysin
MVWHVILAPLKLRKQVMTFKIADHPGILLKKAARLFEQVANKKLDSLGVTHAQTVMLIRLWEADGQNQIELATSAGLNQSTVVRLLDRMERDDLIKRVRNTDDRRVFNFFLTAKSKKICQKLEGHSLEMTTIAHHALSKKDFEKLSQLLTAVTNNLEKFLKDN